MKNFRNQVGHGEVIQMLIVSAIIGSIFIAGTYLWQEVKNQKYTNELIAKIDNISKIIEVEEMKDEGYQLLDNVCNTDQCLFIHPKYNNVYGVGYLTGYYTEYLDKFFGDEKSCDSFTITDGNQELISTVIDMVDSGNAIYHKNELGQPIINFSLTHLSEDQKNIFLNSTEDNPVEVIVSKTYDERAPYYLCFTQMDIISIREQR